MQTRDVLISEIDKDNPEYRLFVSGPDPSLESSISKLGVINPVKLLRKDSGYLVITGWKRLEALEKLNIKKVNSQVFNEDELSSLQLFTYIYTDNKDRFTELEKAELVSKLIKSNTLTDEEIINDFLPVLSLNPTLNNLNKQRSVALMEQHLKEACFNGYITFEQIQLLSEIDDPDFRSGFYNHFLKKFKFNNNEMRDILKDVQAICIRKNIEINQLAGMVFNDTNETADKNSIRKTIKTICYPRLTETEKKYNELVKELKLGNCSRLINHPYFESNDLELRIKFKESKALLNEIELLKETVHNGKIEELLNLIKEGK